MFLLYLDESGDSRDAADHFVVGGLAIQQHDVRNLRKIAGNLKERHLDPHLHGLEIHAQHIRAGKGPWRGIPRPVRSALLTDLGTRLARFNTRAGSEPFGLFAVACDPAFDPPEGRLHRAFEEILLRFQEMLVRIDRAAGRRGLREHTLGIVIADEAKYENVLQPIVRDWREEGTRFKRLSRIVEVPLFVDSSATELIQVADYVAHAVYRSYHAGDDDLLARMARSFDRSDGKLHGLVHLTPDHRTCACRACQSRNRRSRDSAP